MFLLALDAVGSPWHCPICGPPQRCLSLGVFFTTFFEAKAFAPVFGVYEGLCIYLPIAATHRWLVAKHLRFQHIVYKNQGGNPSGVYLYTFPPPSCIPGGDLVPRVRARAAAHADDHEGRGLRRHQRGRVGRRRAPVAVHGELVLPQAYRGPGKRRRIVFDRLLSP